MDVAKRLKELPARPGVYLMKNREGDILYIGKALNLRGRVSSYFRTKGLPPKVAALVGKISDIDFIETPTEMDALLLEARLIRKFSPRYNTLAKDDKSFPLVRITGDRFPRIEITRRKEDRKSVYYGPFTDARLLREAVRMINRIFPLRKCRTLPKRACLYYDIGQCLAPCIQPEVKGEYDRLLREVKEFIGGGKKTMMQYLTEKMEEAARRLAFEEAQFFKEQIQALGNLRKKRFFRSREISGVTMSATAELRKILKLKRFPERIVCFDVSNISGEDAVASRVSFYYEMPDKNEYRRYRIRTVSGSDDYSMIGEALRRMLNAVREGREQVVPDLIMIDGGKGHYGRARQILDREGYAEIPVISIAKQFELVFTGHSESPLVLPGDSKALHLLQRIRDEAHRFAISYHRKLHGKRVFRSLLDEIEGVGEKRKRRLLRHFESVEALKQAPADEIAALPGMNLSVALKILRRLGAADAPI
ncbi:MAG TPA: excinuclease ABC subunit UvrC [Candidatus Omnitrophota bacterium]|nr:excinuclease ABC subunit UvrC [Candidatus Omnitrophota bacterium]